MMLRSMQLFIDRFHVLSDRIAELGFGSIQLLLFEVAYEA